MPKGYYFSNHFATANAYSDKKGAIYSVILNLSNPTIIDNPNKKGYGIGDILRDYIKFPDSGKTNREQVEAIENLKTNLLENGDGVIVKDVFDMPQGTPFVPMHHWSEFDRVDETDTLVVFNSEQIHILGGKQDIEGFKRFVGKPVPAIEKEEEDLAKFQEKIANFKESLKIKNVDTKASNQKIKNQLEQDKQTLLNNGFVKTGENTYSFKTNSYSTFIVKNKERLVQNADIEFQKKDGEYTITYKLKDSADKSRAELQKQGEIPFTQSDLKEALKDRTFVDDLADNIFEGLDEADKALLKKKLDEGDYNINCKL